MAPTVIIGEAVAGKSASLRKRMFLLSTDLTRNTFDLAEALLEAQETHCFLEWGFDSIGDYAELELGVKPRKAQYLARIARVCRDCGVARKDYEPVGVTKLREITTLEPGDTFYNPEEKKHEPMVEHIVRLIAEAPENSTVEVEEEVARLKGMTGENALVHRGYKVTVSCWENTITRCFESIRKRLGSAGRDGTGAAKEYTDGNVIECLCAEYNADPRNFMEEYDASKDQIEVATEESNVRESSGALDTVDSEKVPQDTLQYEQKRFAIPSEDI